MTQVLSKRCAMQRNVRKKERGGDVTLCHGSNGLCWKDVIKTENISANDKTSECFTLYYVTRSPLSETFICPTPPLIRRTQGRPLGNYSLNVDVHINSSRHMYTFFAGFFFFFFFFFLFFIFIAWIGCELMRIDWESLSLNTEQWLIS